MAAWSWPTLVVSRRRVLDVVSIFFEPPSPSRRIFIGSHSLPLFGSPYRSFKVLRTSTATMHLKPCGTTVRCLPLVYKRRRWPPSRESKHKNTTIHPFSLTHALDIGTCLNHLVGTWGSLLLSRLACSPPLRAPLCIAIQRHERKPAGRTTHSQNQDKTRVPLLLSTGHRETDLSASTS
jgi:hypothetical protein